MSLEFSFAFSLTIPFGISRKFVWEIFENSSRNSHNNCFVNAFSHLNQNSFDSLVTNSSAILLGIPAIFSPGTSSAYSLKKFLTIFEKLRCFCFLFWRILQYNFLRFCSGICLKISSVDLSESIREMFWKYLRQCLWKLIWYCLEKKKSCRNSVGESFRNFSRIFLRIPSKIYL